VDKLSEDSKLEWQPISAFASNLTGRAAVRTTSREYQIELGVYIMISGLDGIVSGAQEYIQIFGFIIFLI